MNMNNQNEFKDGAELSRKTGRPKVKHGGSRPGAGRKSRMTENEIIQKLDPMQALAFEKLREKIEAGDINALKIYFNYYLGMPAQKVEQNVTGSLSSVSVEVVRPALVDSQEN